MFLLFFLLFSSHFFFFISWSSVFSLLSLWSSAHFFWNPSCRLWTETTANLMWDEKMPLRVVDLFFLWVNCLKVAPGCVCVVLRSVYFVLSAKKKEKVPKEKSWYFLLLTLLSCKMVFRYLPDCAIKLEMYHIFCLNCTNKRDSIFGGNSVWCSLNLSCTKPNTVKLNPRTALINI